MRRSVLLVLIPALCLSLAGQTITASLEGTVTDPTGGRIAGAKIQVTNTATAVTANEFLGRIDFPATRKYIESILDRYAFYKRRGRM